MIRGWPWETKRLGHLSYVVRPWRPHEDRRVQSAAAAVAGSGAVVGVWHLQGAAAHGSAASLAAGLVLWGWRAWRK